MKHGLILLFAILMFPCISPAQVPQQENFYTKENILRFADYLYRNNENELAIGEYLRIFSLCEDIETRKILAYRIAVADIKLKKPAIARKY